MTVEIAEKARATQGVRHEEVAADCAGQRIDNYLLRILKTVPRSRIYRLLRKGEVRVGGRRVKPEHRLKAGDSVRIPPVRLESASQIAPPRPMREQLRQAIVFEDKNLIALDKPAGIAVHGGSGLSLGVIEALRAERPREALELVHRLDRDTSGCLLIARNRKTLRELHALIRDGAMEKRYLALVRGNWQFGEKRIDVPLQTEHRRSGERHVRAAARGKESVSVFKPAQFFGARATLLEIEIQTGRTHQIRVHAGHTGHPVAGDEKYGDAGFNEEMRSFGLERLFLHAHSVAFSWPGSQEPAHFSAPLPVELRTVIDRLQAAPGRSRAKRR
ncbi:MAG TPA: RluA family pseudouridine synthase [Steroidobacteraceae bacterium]|nr:RluA family pseudouridine synthase [Steroidobacteraceae bacterium]